MGEWPQQRCAAQSNLGCYLCGFEMLTDICCGLLWVHNVVDTASNVVDTASSVVDMASNVLDTASNVVDSASNAAWNAVLAASKA